jgi:hypothetical protein
MRLRRTHAPRATPRRPRRTPVVRQDEQPRRDALSASCSTGRPCRLSISTRSSGHYARRRERKAETPGRIVISCGST